MINKSFKIDSELEKLLEECVNDINKKTSIKISRSDFIRISLKRMLMMIKSGEIAAATIIYNSDIK